MGGLKMTTTVSNNNGKIIIVAALICLFAFAIVNMESVPEVSPSIPEEAISNNPNNPSNAFTNAPKDPTVVDKIYMQSLLNQMMEAAVNDEEIWNDISRLIYMEARNCKKEGLIWDPEKISLVEGKGTTPGMLYFGIDAPSGNYFYAGPLIRWWQEKAGGEVFYEPFFYVDTAGSFESWKKTPYTYGIETFADPPKEVIEVLESNGVKLIC